MHVPRERLRDPVLWADASQLVKTVAAAVLAWVLAVEAFGLAQPFLAPWAALLTVHATVYRTLSRGVQQVGAAVLGVLLAFAAGSVLGVNAASLGLMLLVAMVAGSSRALRAESTTAAATALVVLLTGYSDDGAILVARLLDTTIGIAVGLAVNLVVWPPLRDRSAARRVDIIDDRLGELLTEIARGLREDGDGVDAAAWIDRTRDIDHDVDDAWGALRQAHDSGRLNLRRHASERVRASGELGGLLTRLEQAVAEARSMARTIDRAGPSVQEWDPAFRDAWLALLARLGESICAADAAALARVREDIERAAGALFGAGRATRLRPVHGALLVNLRNIAESMAEVTEAQPIRPYAPPAAA
jgi:uncharacterized membrane protein YccC